MLEILMTADGCLVSSEDRLDRRKLGDPPLIESVVGAGYRL